MIRERTFNAIATRACDGVDLTSTYANRGDALTEPLFIMVLKNTTDVIVHISEDASTSHYELAPGESETYDFQTNKSGSLGVKKVGLQFSVKINNGAAPTCGRVILQGQTI